MFRKRPPRRPRRPRRPGPRQAVALRELRRAHRLMDNGQYAQAFPILKRLAEGAARHGMPIRAAHLFIQAARARLEMGSAPDAVALAQHTIQLMHDAGKDRQLRTLLPRMIQALEERGHHQQAITLRAHMEALLDSQEALQPQESPPQRRLPTRCPACNGPVRADQVTWIDDRSAECVYCGSTLQAE